MYSAEDIQQDYQYSESAKPGSSQPAVYGYQQPQPQDMAYGVDNYQRYDEVMPPAVHQRGRGSGRHAEYKRTVFRAAAAHVRRGRQLGGAAASSVGAAASSASAAARDSKQSRKPPPPDDDLADEEDVIREVHRDEEYVYPSLEMSSDEDEEWTASKRRRNARNQGPDNTA